VAMEDQAGGKRINGHGGEGDVRGRQRLGVGGRSDIDFADIEDAAAASITADTQAEQIEFTAVMIKRTRKRLKLSATEFAKMVGVSPTTIYKWEKTPGKLKLQTRCVQNLVKIYNQ